MQPPKFYFLLHFVVDKSFFTIACGFLRKLPRNYPVKNGDKFVKTCKIRGLKTYVCGYVLCIKNRGKF